MLGMSLGTIDGALVGVPLGMSLGKDVGPGLGAELGMSLGNIEGRGVGDVLGESDGTSVTVIRLPPPKTVGTPTLPSDGVTSGFEEPGISRPSPSPPSSELGVPALGFGMLI